MTMPILFANLVKEVTSRPMKGLAIQFRYQEDCGATRELVQRIVDLLNIQIGTSYDAQSGTGYHVRIGSLNSTLLSDGDWIVVDSFGKVNVVSDKDFKTYYEPEITK